MKAPQEPNASLKLYDPSVNVISLSDLQSSTHTYLIQREIYEQHKRYIKFRATRSSAVEGIRQYLTASDLYSNLNYTRRTFHPEKSQRGSHFQISAEPGSTGRDRFKRKPIDIFRFVCQRSWRRASVRGITGWVAPLKVACLPGRLPCIMHGGCTRWIPDTRVFPGGGPQRGDRGLNCVHVREHCVDKLTLEQGRNAVICGMKCIVQKGTNCCTISSESNGYNRNNLVLEFCNVYLLLLWGHQI